MTIVATKESVTFSALAIVSGKGTTAADKVKAHLSNGAELGALLSAGIGRKAIIDEMSQSGIEKTVQALAGGNIRPACALIVAKSNKAVSIMEVDGKAPYPEFLRLGATLAGMAQVNKAGKPTPAGKAHALWVSLKEASDKIRAEREALKAIK